MKETKMSAEKVVKEPKPKLINIKLEKLHPFEDHPYKVLDDVSMTELVKSIKEYGLLNRIIVRPLEDKQYEFIFLKACISYPPFRTLFRNIFKPC